MSEAVGFVLLSWLAADFVAGIFHWWEDNYAVEDWPMVGTLIAGPNALHHADPVNFTKGSYWERNWTTIVPAAVVGVPTVVFFPSTWLFFVFISQANEVHCWSHQKCNRLIRALQSTGIVASPEHHAKHHREPFDKRYCVMSNILNPILDLVGFWNSIERVGFFLFDAWPKSWR